MRKRLAEAWNEPLYRNSLYLIFNSLIMALFGFVFWSIAAKQFSSEDVGLATAVISAVSLVANLSLLGFNVSILKFKDKSLNYTALLLCSLFALALSLFFVLFVNIFSPNLSFLSSELFYVLGFVAFCILSVIYFILGSMLVAEERNGIVLIKDTLFSLVKVSLIFFISGVFGLLISWYIGVLLASILSLFFVHMDKNIFDIRKVFRFSFYNYVSNVLGILPTVLLPLIIIHYLGASYAAYFYVVWMIANLLFIVPTAMTQNLLSSGKEEKIKKAYMSSIILLLLGVLGLFVIGKFLLNLFNPEYVLALPLLYILALSSIPYGVKRIYQTKLNIQGHVKKVMVMDVITLFVTLVGSVLFIEYGLLAVGLSWLMGNILSIIGVWGE